MSILFDLAAYSALRTRGQIKVAYEQQLMSELGASGYAELKARQKSERNRRGYKRLFWVAMVLFIPVTWIVWPFIIVWWLWKKVLNG